MLGFSSEDELDGYAVTDLASLIPENGFSKIHESVVSTMTVPEKVFSFETILRTKQGGVTWVLFQCSYLEEAGHLLLTAADAARYHAVDRRKTNPDFAQLDLMPGVDMEELSQREYAAEQWNRWLVDIQQESLVYLEFNLTTGHCLNKAGAITYLDRIPTDDFKACVAYMSFRLVNPRDRERFLAFFSRDRLIASIENGRHEETLDFSGITETDDHAWMQATILLGRRPFFADIQALIYFTNIDETESAKKELEKQASTDPLTGLLNRTTFVREVDRLLSDSDRSTRHAIIMIDLDDFKRANDTLGHATGDIILRNVAMILRSLLREGDLIARLGGDEFIICLQSVPDTNVVEKRAQLISELMQKRYGEITVAGTIGISMFPQDGDTFDELYRKADIAMYKGKEFGKKRYAFYLPEMREKDWKPSSTPIDSPAEDPSPA